MNKVSQRRQSRSNEAFFLNGYNTVQTSWRPQLPLPKEVNHISGSHSSTNLYNDKNLSEMDKHSNKSSSSLNNSNSKKWSLGRLFRKKQKDNETDSSSDEQDRKAGFSPSQKPRKKDKRKRSSKLIGAGFDHIVINPKNENEFFVPFEQIELPTPPAEQFRVTNSLERELSKKDRKKAVTTRSNTAQLPTQTNYYPSQTQQQQKQIYLNTSSDEEIIPMQSNKYRSDDSMGTGSGGVIGSNGNDNGNGNGSGSGANRKSRSARTERYYKRMSRDGEISNGGLLPQTVQKVQPYQQISPIPSRSVQIYNDNSNQLPPNRERHKVLLHPEPRPLEQSKGGSHMRQASSLNYVAYPTTLQIRHHIAPGYKAAPIPQTAAYEQQFSQIPSKNLQNSISNDKRSISYDSQIHIPNRNLYLKRENRPSHQQEPPPPPPRDPQRRVHLNSSHNELRPMSLAFDQSTANMNKINGRCVSDDKLWGQNKNLYQNMQRSSSTQPPQTVIYSSIGPKQPPNQGTYITKPIGNSRTPPPAVREHQKPSDFRYVTDAAPRSRKPIHILNQNVTAVSSQNSNLANDQKQIESPIRTTKSGLLPAKPSTVKSASNFWKQIDRQEQYRQGQEYESQRGIRTTKPRSMSSSRVNELQAYRNSTFEDILNANKSQVDGIVPSGRENFHRSRYEQFTRKVNPAQHSSDEVDNIISGSLLIKPSQDKEKKIIEISNQIKTKPHDKTRSMPNYYQTRTSYTNDNPINYIEMPKPNKYDEYVAKQREQNRIAALNNERNYAERNNKATQNSTPKKSLSQDNDPTNIEDVINELEAIYKSLNFDTLHKGERVPKVPLSKEFETYAKEFKEDSSSEEAAEPDIIRDDLALRNMKFSNDLVKTIDNQPPFGIPIGPIPPSPNTDYLHVKPEKETKKTQIIAHNYPDVITDDLAVRSLRKDSPTRSRPRIQYPHDAMRKKQRATRTQSANIYALIQRDAAKPSGGDLSDYYDLQNTLDKAGSLNDISRDIDEPPITLQLLKNLRNQEQQYQSGNTTPKRTVFRHPSQGGAICNLPTVLKSNEERQKPPVPLPRSSISPDPIRNRSGMEEALNQIAKEAKESSEKLSRDLLELRKEALISNTSKNVSSEKNLIDIETTSHDLKRCEEILLEVVPPREIKLVEQQMPPRKLHKEEKYLSDIENVSFKANEVRGKLLVGIEKSKPSNDSKKRSIDVPKTKVEPKPTKVSESSVLVNNEKLVKDSNDNMMVSKLLKNLDPSSDKIGSITERCMRQITALDNNDSYLRKNSAKEETTKSAGNENEGDYDNLNENLKQMTIAASEMNICKDQQSNNDLKNISTENILVPELNKMKSNTNAKTQINEIEETSKLKSQESTGDEEEIIKIMKECEKNTIIKNDDDIGSKNASSSVNVITTSNNSLDNQSKSIINVKKSASTDDSSQHCYGSDATGYTDGGVDQVEGIFITPLYSSSDCIKSSSPGSCNQQMSSSLTSAHNGGFSSSDYIKSPSSDYNNHQSCTSDQIKTFSTTSYDCSTSSATPNLINLSSPICSSEYDNTTNNNSQILGTPSPPLNLTPIGNEVQIKSSSSKSINKSNSIDSINSNHNQSSQYNSSEELAAIFGITRSSSPVTIESQPSIKAIKVAIAPIATTEANEFILNDEYIGKGKHRNMIAKSNNANANVRCSNNSINKKKFHIQYDRTNNNTKCSKCDCIINNQKMNMSDLNLNSNFTINNKNNDVLNETNNKSNAFIIQSLKSILKTNNNNKHSSSDPAALICFACSTKESKIHLSLEKSKIETKTSHLINPNLIEKHELENFSSTASPPTPLIANNNKSLSINTQNILNVIPESQNESSTSPTNSIDSLCNLAATNSQQQDYISFSPRTNTYSSNVHILLSEKNISDSAATNQTIHFDSFSSIEEDNSSNPDSGNVSLSDFPVHQQLYIHNNSSSFEVELEHNSKFNISSKFINEVKIEPLPIKATKNHNESNDEIDSKQNSLDSIIECTDSKITHNEISNKNNEILEFNNEKKVNEYEESICSTPDSFKSLDSITYLYDDLHSDINTNFEIQNIISIQVPLLKQTNQLKPFFKPSEYDDDDFYTDDNQLSSIEEEDEDNILSDCDDNVIVENCIESEIEPDDLELKQFELLENQFKISSSSSKSLATTNFNTTDTLSIDLTNKSKVCNNNDDLNIDENTENSNDWKLIDQRISLPSTSRNDDETQNHNISQNHINVVNNSNHNDDNTIIKYRNINHHNYTNNDDDHHNYNNDHDDENNNNNDNNNNNNNDNNGLFFSNKLQLAHPDAARTTILEHMIIICTYGLASNDVFTFFAIIVAVITLIAFLLF